MKLLSPKFTGGSIALSGRFSTGSATIAYASTITPNCDNYNKLRIGILTGNITIANPTGTPADGQMLKLKVVEDATGGRTITFGTAYVIGDVPASADIITSANKKQLLAFEYDADDSKWWLVGISRR